MTARRDRSPARPRSPGTAKRAAPSPASRRSRRRGRSRSGQSRPEDRHHSARGDSRRERRAIDHALCREAGRLRRQHDVQPAAGDAIRRRTRRRKDRPSNPPSPDPSKTRGTAGPRRRSPGTPASAPSHACSRDTIPPDGFPAPSTASTSSSGTPQAPAARLDVDRQLPSSAPAAATAPPPGTAWPTDSAARTAPRPATRAVQSTAACVEPAQVI